MSFKIKDSGERSHFDGGAVRDMATGKGRFDLISPFAMMRLAKWYEMGANKYEDRNWEKGIPFHSFLNSALRHLTKYLMGWRDEDHLAAAAWNVFCLIHFEEVGRPDLDDLPHYQHAPGEVTS